MPAARSARAAVVAVLALTIAGCGTSAANPTPRLTPPPTGAQAPRASPTAAPTPAPAEPLASSTGGPMVYDTTPLGAAFDLPTSMTLPEGWKPLPPPLFNPDGTVGAVKTGNPPDDDSQWWGFGLDLVDGASVADPKDMAKPAHPGDTKVPWPSSYIDYLVGLPGVTVVTGPEPTKVGGVDARQVTVRTPPMHPTIFLKGDTMWLGGGATGTDPALTRHLVELTVHGKRLVIEYVDFASPFDERFPTVDAIIRSIAFPG